MSTTKLHLKHSGTEPGMGGGKSQSFAELFWTSKTSMNTPRRLVARDASLSASTTSLNWSGGQAQIRMLSRKTDSHTDVESPLAGPNEILAPTVSMQISFLALYKAGTLISFRKCPHGTVKQLSKACRIYGECSIINPMVGKSRFKWNQNLTFKS